MAVFLKEIFVPKSIPIQMAKIVKAEPKSGCLNIKKNIGRTQNRLLKIFTAVGLFFDQKEARNRINTGFANSEG